MIWRACDLNFIHNLQIWTPLIYIHIFCCLVGAQVLPCWEDQNSNTEQFTTWVFTNSRFNQFTKSKFCILGAQLLVEKLKQYKPRVAVFNGKGIFEVFARQKEFHFGKQPDKIEGTETVSIWFCYNELFITYFNEFLMSNSKFSRLL